MNYQNLALHWWNNWQACKAHARGALLNQRFADAVNYCRASCMAQANYEMYRALDERKVKP